MISMPQFPHLWHGVIILPASWCMSKTCMFSIYWRAWNIASTEEIFAIINTLMWSLLQPFRCWKCVTLRKLPRATVAGKWLLVELGFKPTSLSLGDHVFYQCIVLFFSYTEAGRVALQPDQRPQELLPASFLVVKAKPNGTGRYQSARCRMWQGRLPGHPSQYLMYPFEALCSEPVKGNLETGAHGGECWLLLTLTPLLYLQWQPHRLNQGLTYLWVAGPSWTSLQWLP